MKTILLKILVLSFIAGAKAQSDNTLFYQPSTVTYYDSSKTEKGINILHDEGNRTILVNMYGTILKVLPVNLAVFNADGTILGATNGRLVKFDADFNIIWSTPASANGQEIHHDIVTDTNGCIYLLSSDMHRFMGLNVRFDVMKIYSPQGALIYSWCVHDHLEQFISAISKSAWCKDLPLPYDPAKGPITYISQAPERFINTQMADDSSCSFEFTHFNSIQVLPANNIYKEIPAFKPGNLLLSFNPYASYGIIDTGSGKIEWVGYLPERTTLHTSRLTPAGTILVFQNSTDGKEYTGKLDNSSCLEKLPAKTFLKQPVPKPESRPWTSVTEYNPITGMKIWEYTTNPKETMNSVYFGSAQRLPNGNTLVVATDQKKGGRVFEMTPQKEIVWNYYPDSDPGSPHPINYYRATRVPFEAAKKIIHGFKE